MKFIALITTARAVWRAREQFFRGDFPCFTLVEINATGFIGAG